DVLAIEDAGFTLTERIDGQARFEPLSARGARLQLSDNVIAAQGTLRHPATGTRVLDVEVRHDLGTGRGSSTIEVPDLTLGTNLDLVDLTYLVRGVIADTTGTITGSGEIAWSPDKIESSGSFTTEGLDLAAAFGPIRQLRGTVRFSDLVNLTTEPGQVIEIGSINPGIEVLGGRLVFSMTDGEIIAIEDGRWPFMGGELIMRPVTLRYGTEEFQRYTFEIIGLDAAKFVTQMELSNLGASGIFDGTVPIVFDSNGNGRIEGGLVISRPPGGNVSYIGELTYEDLGAISNYAFESLRSLDYTQMSIALEGNLAGEIVTRFAIDGVRQGRDADRNFVTRQLADLPIRFNINVRSQNFYQLATMVRSFSDPEVLSQEIARRMLDQPNLEVSDEGPPDPEQPEPDPTAIKPDEPAVQPPESEDMP
ncbi:MAG: YdbH domain-containing protein, partial [Pseudomonadota bacterium]|nr:YdbH domain-containing protein [Pseudomonadota bacterium]